MPKTERKSYQIWLVTPKGWEIPIEGYGLNDKFDAFCELELLAEVLGRVPTELDPEQFRDAWMGLAEMSETPRHCQARLVELVGVESERNYLHGWASVAILNAFRPQHATAISGNSDCAPVNRVRQYFVGG